MIYIRPCLYMSQGRSDSLDFLLFLLFLLLFLGAVAFLLLLLLGFLLLLRSSLCCLFFIFLLLPLPGVCSFQRLVTLILLSLTAHVDHCEEKGKRAWPFSFAPSSWLWCQHRACYGSQQWRTCDCHQWGSWWAPSELPHHQDLWMLKKKRTKAIRKKHRITPSSPSAQIDFLCKPELDNKRVHHCIISANPLVRIKVKQFL